MAISPSDSARSTAVYAAALITTSGRTSPSVAATASPCVMSSWARESGTSVTSGGAVATRSWPSIPPAPRTSTRITRSSGTACSTPGRPRSTPAPTSRAARGTSQPSQPVAHVQAVPIHRQRLVGQGARDHQGDELLGKLVRTVVVGAARDHRREVERLYVRPHQQIRRGLAGGVGAVGRERRRLGEGGVRSEEHTSELQSPYDLVCRLLLEKK